jgi:membrane fusion protein (multidrug efflux system)
MFARVTPVFGVRDDARMIPEEAIVPQGGRQFVWKLVDGPDQDTRIAQRVEVRVGIRQPGKVEVTEGLVPGDMVVTAGQQRIQKDGTPVRVLDLSRNAGAGGPPATGAAGAGPAERTAPPLAQAAAQAGNPCGTVAAAGSRGMSAGKPTPARAPARAPNAG